MKRKLFIVVCFLMIFFPKEARVSQIMIEEIDPMPLSEMISLQTTDETHILVVKGPVKNEIFKEVTFPQSTHYQKKEESVYQEFVYQYRIEQVLRSKTFKQKDTFWSVRESAYTYEDIKQYHEEGMLASPIVLETRPNYPIEDDRMIAFITRTGKNNEVYPETYRLDMKEGVGALSEVKSLLKIEQKKWWEIWK